MSAHYGAGVTVVTVTAAVIEPPRADGLAVYWVGYGVCVAAYSPQQARALALARVGPLNGGDVWKASRAHLDREWQSQDGRSLGTLRAVLGVMREPGCIIAPGYWRGLDE